MQAELDLRPAVPGQLFPLLCKCSVSHAAQVCTDLVGQEWRDSSPGVPRVAAAGGRVVQVVLPDFVVLLAGIPVILRGCHRCILQHHQSAQVLQQC